MDEPEISTVIETLLTGSYNSTHLWIGHLVLMYVEPTGPTCIRLPSSFFNL